MNQSEQNDRALLRELAGRVRQRADHPSQARTEALWRAHNRMQGERPMVLVFPENSWAELVPDSVLVCRDPFLRGVERDLRKLVYRIDYIDDDFVIRPRYQLWQTTDDKLDWGFSGRPRGDGAFPFQSEEDLAVLKASNHRTVFDDAQTAEHKAHLEDVFGDLLTVEPILPFYTSSITWDLVRLRDMTTLMMDLALRPDFFHAVMQTMCEAIEDNFLHMERQGRLTDNTTGQFLSSGTLGYSDELPRTEKGALRLSDLWGFADSQEFTGVSPAMFREMLLPYQKRLLAHFGLNYYACCEVIDEKLDDILTIPNLRKVSVSPWTDRRIAAEKIEDRAIYCRKPDPAKVIYHFDEDAVKKETEETLAITRGMHLEIVLKDLNTLDGRPERIGRYLDIVNRLVGK